MKNQNGVTNDVLDLKSRTILGNVGAGLVPALKHMSFFSLPFHCNLPKFIMKCI